MFPAEPMDRRSLLQLSGLGPAQHLQDNGIQVIRDMPAVGSNLHDHFNTTASWRCSKPITLNDLQNNPLRKIAAGIRYGLFRSGPMARNGVTAGVFTRSDPRLERPDIQVNLFEWSTKERSRDAVTPHPFPGFTLTPVHLRPDGRGTVRLNSPDPFAWPAVLFDYLRTDYDIQAALMGLRLVRRIAEQPALQPYVVSRDLSLAVDIASDDELLDYVRRTGVSNQHPTSTCAMGNGPNTVVDPRLRVHGIAGLRVADASIMPVVVGGNTNAPTIMIGEKAAAMILEDAKAGAPAYGRIGSRKPIQPLRIANLAKPRDPSAQQAGGRKLPAETNATYDFIVTGAGSAGCVLAARLTESGRYRVLLLEAGGNDTSFWIHVPMGYAKTFVDPKVNWKFESEPEKELNSRTMYQPRGKVLGGTSSINGMIYMRGNAADYDQWRQLGNEGWDYESVLPYFRKAEDNERGADDYHGSGGPLRVSTSPTNGKSPRRCWRHASRPGFPPIRISTAPSRRAAATTRRRRRTSAAGARPPPICGWQRRVPT